ncbi:helix-turn-helix domain-containing protein [Mesobacillus zeae]|uniref:XRE family transcriptional regulator n=1 Tax=Mesobacillus zeae TaxID=1917180 RepID=A0A398B0Z6_9BACI|nr:helix-turn-helix transcriptional regulator [Mesobacillus zeae]RID83361.1 XRE family transcriptional regulator [Mesobacillus zeae]
MKTIHISTTLIRKRKERGITQEELAQYIGVSKASVSKWETGMSYPDILLLPELATYFNITVDELIGYSPQLTQEDIRKVYARLTHSFATKPFIEAKEECDGIIKKYYSCFPLLLAMCQLLINHCVLASTEEGKKEVIAQCVVLCKRVKEESTVLDHAKQANAMEAISEMMLGNSSRVIELLSNVLDPYSGEDVLLVGAYQSKGEPGKANEVCQVLLYQETIKILSLLTTYLSMHITEPQLFETIYGQGKQLISSFDMSNFVANPVTSIHLVAAQGYLMQEEKRKALDALAEYVETVCRYRYPLKLRGNDYFNKINGWLEEKIPLGTDFPREEKTIKQTFLQMVEVNPVFALLQEEPEFKRLLNKLKREMGV